MKKKVILILLVVLSVFLFFGCNNSINNDLLISCDNVSLTDLEPDKSGGWSYAYLAVFENKGKTIIASFTHRGDKMNIDAYEVNEIPADFLQGGQAKVIKAYSDYCSADTIPTACMLLDGTVVKESDQMHVEVKNRTIIWWEIWYDGEGYVKEMKALSDTDSMETSVKTAFDKAMSIFIELYENRGTLEHSGTKQTYPPR
jgi:hypothetical protein